MAFEFSPRTDAGARLFRAAEQIIPVLREHAAQADKTGQISTESFAALKASGIPAAFVPESLGGFGLTSIHDWLVGIATLARGDGSVAIAINMHLGVTRGMAEAWRNASPGSDAAERLSVPLKAVAAGKMLICATATERGTDNLHPFTTATKTDDGWCINGYKMFVTMSPVATHLAMNLRMQDEEGDHLATTLLPIGTPGVVPQDDWDSLGMRGSGSQSIAFEKVTVSKSAVRKLGPWGKWSIATLINRTLGNLVLVGAFFGIAAHARELALAAIAQQKKVGKRVVESPGVQQSAGELEIEFAKCRCVLQQTGSDVDDWLESALENPPSLESAHGLMQGYQAAKWTVNPGAIVIVRKAMELAGGGGFMSANPLTRLYRDVRAGPFMQPQAATDIRMYVGQVALGQYPED
ncbi:MAG: acyl-CoA/acyl-ACP dehydrogenase [Pseudomonadales bacterium]|nr:acyl-CoA/acyl-ACP dehydrogenase [Pseudomonadales bacterium]